MLGLIHFKMKYISAVPGKIRKNEIMEGKGLSLGWGFMMHVLHDKVSTESICVIYGKQSYLIIVYYHTGKFCNILSISKTPPSYGLTYIHHFIHPQLSNIIMFSYIMEKKFP